MYKVSQFFLEQDRLPGGILGRWLWPLVSLLMLYVLFVLIPVYTSGMYLWSDGDIILRGTFDPIFYEDLTLDDVRLSVGFFLTLFSMYLLPVVLIVAIVLLGVHLSRHRPIRGIRDHRVLHLCLMAGSLLAILFTWPLADTFVVWLAD